MKQGTKRLLSMALALVFIVGSFVIYFELTQPSYNELEQIQGKRRGQEQVLSEQQTAVKNVQELIANYTGESAGDLRNALSETLPLGPNLSSALVQLEGLVQMSGLTLQSLSPQAARGTTIPSSGPLIKPVGVFVFRLSFLGSYSQIKDFFSKLQSNVLLFEVRSFSVQPVGKGGQDFFSGSAEVVSYYQQI